MVMADQIKSCRTLFEVRACVSFFGLSNFQPFAS